MTRKMREVETGNKIEFPKGVDPFDVLEAAGTGMDCEEVVRWIKELIWRGEQGCSQAMRCD